MNSRAKIVFYCATFSILASLCLFSCSSEKDSPTSPGGPLQPPGQAPVLRAQAILLNSITVTCSARVAGAARYGFFRSPSATGTFVSVGEISDIAFTDTGLADTTPYFYTARAGNDAGWGPFSDTVSATTLAPAASAPLAPPSFIAEAVSPTTVRLSWTAAAAGSPAASFEIYRSVSPVAPDSSSLIAEVAGFAYTDAGPLADTLYYAIRARNSAGVSAFRFAVVIPPAPPAVPQGVAAQAVSPSSILISWHPSGAFTDSVTYHVFRGSSATGSFALIAKTGSASYLDQGLLPLTTCFYKVKAENSLGLSAFSAAASASTPADQSHGYDIYTRDTGSYASTAGRIVTYGFQTGYSCSCTAPQPYACSAYVPVPETVRDTAWLDYSLNGDMLVLTENDTADPGCVSTVTSAFTRSGGGIGLAGTWISSQKPSYIENGPCDTGFLSQKMMFDSLERVEQTLVLGPGGTFSRTVRADFSLCWAAHFAQAMVAGGIDSAITVSTINCSTAFITANQETLYVVFDLENGVINYTYENKSCFNYWLNDNPPPDCSQEACLQDLYRTFWTNAGAGLRKAAAGARAAVPAPPPLRVKAFQFPRL